jgi:hypothetical protein
MARRATKEELERYNEGDTLPGGGRITPLGTIVGGSGYTDAATGKSYSSKSDYDAAMWSAFNKKSPAPSGSLSSSSEVIGSGPFAGMTQAEMTEYEKGLKSDYGQDTDLADLVTSDYYGSLQQSGYQEFKLSKNDSLSLIKNTGLTGLVDDDAFVGLNPTQAKKKAAEIREDKLNQTSQLTSFAYNPETIAGTRKAIDNFKFKLDDLNNNSWNVDETREAESPGLLESTANEISKLFQSSQDFLQQYNTNPELQTSLKAFTDAGGDVNSIATRADKTVTTTGNQQTVDQYLGALNTPAKQRAYESLIPEGTIAQEKIQMFANIPKQHMDLYFGTDDKVGIVETKRIQAEERIKIAEKQAKQEEKNLERQAQFAIEKNRAQMDIEEAQIEENRLAAKNYTTGMLAKLGALKTTGAAIEGLANLEQKYQRQAQQLRTSYDFANRNIELQLEERVGDIRLQTESNILKIAEDLTLDEEKVMKETLKLQQQSAKDIYNTLDDYAKRFRTQTDKYSKEAKALATKNASEFNKVVGEYEVETLYDYMQKTATPKTKQSLTGNKMEAFPGFIQQSISSGELSSYTERVLNGEKALGDYSTKIQSLIRSELDKLRINPADLKKYLGTTKSKSDDGEDDIDTGDDLEYLRSQGIEV